MSVPQVSLSMIVRNEELNLERCLSSVQGLFGEIVIVDTGSTDRTIEIARHFTSRVYEHAWEDSFAVARNHCLHYCQMPWVMWMDADEHVSQEDRNKLRKLLLNLPDSNSAFVLQCRCEPNSPEKNAVIVEHVRLFRKAPELTWEYRVHEQILPSLRRLGSEVAWGDVVIQHSGYLDPNALNAKLLRNKTLLLQDLEDRPGDAHRLLQLALTHQELGELGSAISCLRQALSDMTPQDSNFAVAVAEYAKCQRLSGNLSEAISAVDWALQVRPNATPLLVERCELFWQLRDFTGAERCLQALLQSLGEREFGSSVEGSRGVVALHKLAVIRFEQGRLEEAAQMWQRVLRSNPSFRQAQRGLAEIARRRGILPANAHPSADMDN